MLIYADSLTESRWFQSLSSSFSNSRYIKIKGRNKNPGIIDNLVADSHRKRFSVNKDYINKYLQLVISGGDDPLTRGFEKNGFPQFYHCTKVSSLHNCYVNWFVWTIFKDICVNSKKI